MNACTVRSISSPFHSGKLPIMYDSFVLCMNSIHPLLPDEYILYMAAHFKDPCYPACQTAGASKHLPWAPAVLMTVVILSWSKLSLPIRVCVYTQCTVVPIYYIEILYKYAIYMMKYCIHTCTSVSCMFYMTCCCFHGGHEMQLMCVITAICKQLTMHHASYHKMHSTLDAPPTG